MEDLSQNKGNFARGEISSADTRYIQSKVNSGLTPQVAYQSLLADEIYRRVSQAVRVFGPEVKLMIYGDTYDNQSWGSVPLEIQYGNGEKITLDGVIDLPGLTEKQKNRVKEQVIPILWNYHGKIERADNPIQFLTRADYNTDAVFNRFVSRGFNVIYCGVMKNGSRNEQIQEFATVSRKYQNNCIGYFVKAWEAPAVYNYMSPHSGWNILEYMGRLK